MSLPKNFELNANDLKYDAGMLYRQEIGSVEVGVKEAPIYLHVDSDTDWATVVPAGAGVVVALLVAWLTVSVQKNQIKGNVSNFRHHWMSELRDTAAELIGLLTYLINMNSKEQGFKKSEDYYEACSRASQLKAKVELLLSRDDDESRALIASGTEALRVSIQVKYKEAASPALIKVKDYRTLLRRELEQAWIDTKNDLGMSSKIIFPRLLKRRKKQPSDGRL
ncbi:hypothetical protein ABE459_03970 [Pseudomonas sp. TWI923]|uniref:hypothetical protein n=1 Tax=Pseudomonas sp. TWI923 TaxID=3136794 RepID=UPI003208AB4F